MVGVKDIGSKLVIRMSADCWQITERGLQIGFCKTSTIGWSQTNGKMDNIKDNMNVTPKLDNCHNLQFMLKGLVASLKTKLLFAGRFIDASLSQNDIV